MDILTDHRITALVVREQELAERAERVRIAAERAERPSARPATTGSLVCVPSTSQ